MSSFLRLTDGKFCQQQLESKWTGNLQQNATARCNIDQDWLNCHYIGQVTFHITSNSQFSLLNVEPNPSTFLTKARKSCLKIFIFSVTSVA